MFKLSNVSVHVNQKTLLNSASVSFCAGKINTIIGANGAGKSTLFKALLGEHHHIDGEVAFNQRSLNAYAVDELSKQRAYIAQARPSVFSMVVFDYLVLARVQYVESQQYSANLVLNISAQFNVHHLLINDISQLSGGELQLIEFVRAYIQVYESANMRGKCLLLDEPASALDIKQTKLLYEHIKAFNNANGTVIIIDHNINAIAGIADYMLLLKSGSVLAQGDTASVFTQDNLNACFETQGMLIKHPQANTPLYHLPTAETAFQAHSVSV